MAVKLRMTRTGAKNSASFRIVASDGRFPRDGRFNEILGWYDPKLSGENFCIKLDRVEDWLGKGAGMSDAVATLVRKARLGGGIAPGGETIVSVDEPVADDVVAEEAVAEETADVPEEAAVEKTES